LKSIASSHLNIFGVREPAQNFELTFNTGLRFGRQVNSFVNVFVKLKTKLTTRNSVSFCNHYRNWKRSDQWRYYRFQPRGKRTWTDPLAVL